MAWIYLNNGNINDYYFPTNEHHQEIVDAGWVVISKPGNYIIESDIHKSLYISGNDMTITSQPEFSFASFAIPMDLSKPVGLNPRFFNHKRSLPDPQPKSSTDAPFGR